MENKIESLESNYSPAEFEAITLRLEEFINKKKRSGVKSDNEAENVLRLMKHLSENIKNGLVQENVKADAIRTFSKQALEFLQIEGE
jgi:hypothetical protein